MRQADVFVWWDEWEIKVGDSIVQKISEGITESAYLAVVLSPASVNSNWVQKELNSALMRQLSAERAITILPLFLEDCKVPAFLQEIKWADFREEYAYGLHELLGAIEQTPPAPKGPQPSLPRNIPKTLGVWARRAMGVIITLAMIAALMITWPRLRSWIVPPTPTVIAAEPSPKSSKVVPTPGETPTVGPNFTLTPTPTLSMMPRSSPALPVTQALTVKPGSTPQEMSGLISVVQHFPAPGALASGMTWDGSHLWIADNSGTIFKVDTAGEDVRRVLGARCHARGPGVGWYQPLAVHD